jgi:chromate reductase
MNPPEAYIQFTLDLVTNEGEVTNDSTAEFLAQFMGEFHLFIAGVFGSAERCVEA